MKSKPFLFSCATFALLQLAQPLCANTHVGGDQYNRQLFVDYLLQKRNGLKGATILNKSGIPKLNSRDLLDKMHRAEGFMVGFRNHYRDTFGIEGNYGRVLLWSTHITAKGEGNLSFPFRNSSYTDVFYNSDVARHSYESVHDTSELNMLLASSPPGKHFYDFRWVFGARYFGLREKYGAEHMKNNEKGNYTIKTNNRLVVAQAGVQLVANPISYFGWEMGGKIGGGVNFAKQATQLIDHGETWLRDYTARRVVPGMVIEGHTKARLKVFESFIITCGYRATYGNGLSLAPQQIDLRRGENRQLNNNGYVVLHGVTVGFEMFF